MPADVDGDGQLDLIVHRWDPVDDEAVVTVCLSSGEELSSSGLGQAEALWVLDLDGDGTAEVLPGATGISYAAFAVLVDVKGQLSAVSTKSGPLEVQDGITQHDDKGVSTEVMVVGCEDMNDDDVADLVQVKVTYQDGAALWTRTGYAISGATAAVVGTDQGRADHINSESSFPASLVQPCRVLPVASGRTTLDNWTQDG